MLFEIIFLFILSECAVSCSSLNQTVCEIADCWWNNGACVRDTYSEKCQEFYDENKYCPSEYLCDNDDNNDCKRAFYDSCNDYDNEYDCEDEDENNNCKWISASISGEKYNFCSQKSTPYDFCSYAPGSICESFRECIWISGKCSENRDNSDYCSRSILLEGECNTTKCIEDDYGNCIAIYYEDICYETYDENLVECKMDNDCEAVTVTIEGEEWSGCFSKNRPQYTSGAFRESKKLITIIISISIFLVLLF